MNRAIDLIVVVAYLAFIAGLGVWFSRRQTTAENYFVAKRSVPFWAMGMSMLATMVSSVTFVAIRARRMPRIGHCWYRAFCCWQSFHLLEESSFRSIGKKSG